MSCCANGLTTQDTDQPSNEVSPYFYVYAKLALLRYAVSGEEGGGGPASGHAAGGLLGVSLYTPRLVELTMPRRRVDMQAGPLSSSSVSSS